MGSLFVTAVLSWPKLLLQFAYFLKASKDID